MKVISYNIVSIAVPNHNMNLNQYFKVRVNVIVIAINDISLLSLFDIHYGRIP